MRVLVCGSTGCIGSAIVGALRARGHVVIEAARRHADGPATMRIDFMRPVSPQAWCERLRPHRLDAVVNAAGILMPSRDQSFDRVHADGLIELFRGAALAGVRRIVQLSALGVGPDPAALERPYLASKLRADDTLAGLPLEWAVLRPSLVHGPGSQSAALFATLAAMPVIALPGRGAQRVQPIHVYEVAEAVARLLESREGWCAVHELAGPAAMSYREMLAAYRDARGSPAALWLRVPLPLMMLGARIAELLPQRVYCRETLCLLERGSVTADNAGPRLLGRAPTALARGLQIAAASSRFQPQVVFSPGLEAGLRAALAFMWVYTALVSALWPQDSGVLELLARCGFEGQAGLAMLVASCGLNAGLGMMVLLRPSPWVYALQSAAVVGYTATAAWNMPELTLDHCGPLVKNLPVLGLVLVLWMAQPVRSPRERLRHTRADADRAAAALRT